MKTPYILPDPKDRKLAISSRTTWYRPDKFGSLLPKIKIQKRNYHSYAQLAEALGRLGETDHV
jgi:hypothetical protein